MSVSEMTASADVVIDCRVDASSVSEEVEVTGVEIDMSQIYCNAFINNIDCVTSISNAFTASSNTEVVTTLGESYKGPYLITPKRFGSSINTKGKNMTRDITVSAIPYHESKNERGTTITIGG